MNKADIFGKSHNEVAYRLIRILIWSGRGYSVTRHTYSMGRATGSFNTFALPPARKELVSAHPLLSNCLPLC